MFKTLICVVRLLVKEFYQHVYKQSVRVPIYHSPAKMFT